MHRSLGFILVTCVALVTTTRCGNRDSVETPSRVTSASPPASSRPRIVALGDSLTAGLGLTSDQAYPAHLQARVRTEGYDFEVVNAGVSGDTTAGGLRRLDWALDGDVRILIVALGANDGLRGLSIPEMKGNLTEIITRAKQRGVRVLLAGMEALPNLGPAYTVEFRKAFQELAREHEVVFVPFLLRDVAGRADLNQADGIHPTADGARLIAETLWPALRSMLDEGRAR